jgi:hypothetical protein
MDCEDCGQRPNVPAAVVDALRSVRETRVTDMYQRETVIALTREMGLREAYVWLNANRHLYFDALRASDADEHGMAVLAA